MEAEKKKKREKRVYDEAFRREAVALLESSPEPLSELAARLGVSHWNLARLAQALRLCPGPGPDWRGGVSAGSEWGSGALAQRERESAGAL